MPSEKEMLERTARELAKVQGEKSDILRKMKRVSEAAKRAATRKPK